MKKAILLDMDGTLVDTIPAIFEEYLSFSEDHGFVGSREEFDSLVGPSIREVMAILKERHAITNDLEELIVDYTQRTKAAYKKAPLFEGVRESIEWMKEKKLALALVTAAPFDTAKYFLEVQGLSSYFSFVIGGDQVEKAKPHPELFLKALAELMVRAEDAYVVEDSPKGIEASVRAGIDTLYITHGYENYASAENNVQSLKDWKEISEHLTKVL